MGVEFTVGSQSLHATALGMCYLAGNVNNHNVFLCTINGQGGNIATTIISASVPSSGTVGQITYTAISPTALAANTTYVILADFLDVADNFYNIMTPTITGAGTIYGSLASFTSSSPFSVAGAGNNGAMYGPVSFQYTIP